MYNNYSDSEKIALVFAHQGVSNAKFFQVWNLFDGFQDFLSNFENNITAKKLLAANFSPIVTALKRKLADEYIKELNQYGIIAVTCFSDSYPQTLHQIDDKPYLLYCKGDLSLLDSDCLAVVGTRKVSTYGRRVTKDFTAVLSEYFTIVSGLAYGVDAIAHETTLENEGKTIAVLGSGLLNVYPSSHQNLADKIVANGGLLVSEYGLMEEPLAYHFPARNRIVSALSKGLLVCQAPEKSGTNSTVEFALEQGKDVFVIPGEVYDMGFKGSNRLIKSMQGACVTTPRDIVDYYNLDSYKNATQSYQLSIEEQMIVNVLTDGQLGFDQIVQQTQLSPVEVLFLLSNLELRNIITKLPGNSYQLCGGLE